MKQNGIVLTTDGKTATVSVLRASACEGCHRHAEGCTACSLLAGDRRHTAKVQNPIGALPGERVTVEASDSHILACAAVLFVLPVLLALASYMIGVSLFGDGSSAPILFGIGGLLVSALFSCLLSAYLSHRAPLSVIVARLSSESESTPTNSER